LKEDKVRQNQRKSVARVLEGETMQFEVNGQEYFLNLVEDESRWYVFIPSLTGLQKMPVYVDVPKFERIGIMQKSRHKIQN
jgi:hypothetical protein